MCQSAAVPRIHDAAFFFGIDVRFFLVGGGRLIFVLQGKKVNVD